MTKKKDQIKVARYKPWYPRSYSFFPRNPASPFISLPSFSFVETHPRLDTATAFLNICHCPVSESNLDASCLSAKCCRPMPCLSMIRPNFVWIIRTGPSTEAWGTPHCNREFIRLFQVTFTCWHRPIGYDRNHCRATPTAPFSTSKRCSSGPWSTVSKAALRSSRVSRMTFPLLTLQSVRDCVAGFVPVSLWLCECLGDSALEDWCQRLITGSCAGVVMGACPRLDSPCNVGIMYEQTQWKETLLLIWIKVNNRQFHFKHWSL